MKPERCSANVRRSARRGVSMLCGMGLSMLVSLSVAHEVGDLAGGEVCLEGNFMMADAQNAPFADANGPGRVVEMNMFTGTLGIVFGNPFIPDNVGTAIMPQGIVPGGWKPTGVLSGGLNGHAFITSAAQHALTEFHRDGTPVRSVKLPMDTDERLGTVPRLLGSQMMPNGNIIQNVCDANFFNAVNSDPDPGAPAGNSSNNYFPPVYSTPERAANSRLLVIDQETLKVVDEYSAPDDPRWTCMAGVVFSDEGMFVSMFHGAAVFVIDWKAGIDDESAGVGRNEVTDKDEFKLNRPRNKAKVIRVIDMLPHLPPDDPMRRDSLRAISLDSSGNLYATFRMRSRACLKGEVPGVPGGCNPGVFRQHIAVVPHGASAPTRTIALDPGVNVIAGIRTNRISGPGCDAINPVDPLTGKRADPKACNVETLLVAASAFNPGCSDTSGPAPNPCFVPGGGVGEYLIGEASADGATGVCSGDPVGDNSGCAQPIATFLGEGTADSPKVDPRMLMMIHEAFVQ